MAKIRTFGRGAMFNADNTPGKMTSFGGLNIEWETSTLELPDDSDFTASSFEIPLGTKATVTFSFNSFDANIWAIVTGGTTTASLSLHYIESETFTVPSAPGAYTVTAANTPLDTNDGGTVIIARVYAKDGSGDVTEMSQVAGGSEVAGASYSVVAATGVFTFAAGDADKVYYCDYFYTGTAGTQVTVGRDDMPTEFEFRGYIDAATLGGTKQHAVKIVNIVPSMPANWGAERLAAGGAIEITAGVKAEDIIFTFNT